MEVGVGEDGEQKREATNCEKLGRQSSLPLRSSPPSELSRSGRSAIPASSDLATAFTTPNTSHLDAYPDIAATVNGCAAPTAVTPSKVLCPAQVTLAWTSTRKLRH